MTFVECSVTDTLRGVLGGHIWRHATAINIPHSVLNDAEDTLEWLQTQMLAGHGDTAMHSLREWFVGRDDEWTLNVILSVALAESEVLPDEIE